MATEVDLETLRQRPVTEILLAGHTMRIVTLDASDRDAIVAALERAQRNEEVMRSHKTQTFQDCACGICSRVRELDAPEGGDG